MTQTTYALVPDGTKQYFNLPFTVQSVEVNNQSSAIVVLARNDATQTVEMQLAALSDGNQNVTNGNSYVGYSVIASKGPITLTFSDAPVSPSSTTGPSSVQQQVIPLTAVVSSFTFHRGQAKFAQFFVEPTADSIPAGHGIFFGSAELGLLDAFAALVSNGSNVGPFTASFGQGAISGPDQAGIGFTQWSTFLAEDITIKTQVAGDHFSVAVFATA